MGNYVRTADERVELECRHDGITRAIVRVWTGIEFVVVFDRESPDSLGLREEAEQLAVVVRLGLANAMDDAQNWMRN